MRGSIASLNYIVKCLAVGGMGMRPCKVRIRWTREWWAMGTVTKNPRCMNLGVGLSMRAYSPLRFKLST